MSKKELLEVVNRISKELIIANVAIDSLQENIIDLKTEIAILRNSINNSPPVLPTPQPLPYVPFYRDPPPTPEWFYPPPVICKL